MTQCGEGRRERSRGCSGGGTCQGDSTEVEGCRPRSPVCGGAGGWAEWSDWSSCDCGERSVRVRRCAQGASCTGRSIQERSCGQSCRRPPPPSLVPVSSASFPFPPSLHHEELISAAESVGRAGEEWRGRMPRLGVREWCPSGATGGRGVRVEATAARVAPGSGAESASARVGPPVMGPSAKASLALRPPPAKKPSSDASPVGSDSGFGYGLRLASNSFAGKWSVTAEKGGDGCGNERSLERLLGDVRYGSASAARPGLPLQRALRPARGGDALRRGPLRDLVPLEPLG